MPEVLEKTKAIRELIDNNSLNVDVEIDGGINFENCKVVKNAGANVLVSGSTIFKEKFFLKVFLRLYLFFFLRISTFCKHRPHRPRPCRTCKINRLVSERSPLMGYNDPIPTMLFGRVWHHYASCRQRLCPWVNTHPVCQSACKLSARSMATEQPWPPRACWNRQASPLSAPKPMAS